ncbi:acyltransferase [Dentipellis sp. KUC8613]|nr:acyltransferase [Dentipellis sp. KUC8613]
MELMLVYRALRKISDWTLSTFYAEVYVSGQENVPEKGPFILCSNHHNEIIDIATLAATIPHRRQVCFWAKSGMFKNPISRFIMVSSGSIPVNRNPNSAASNSTGNSPPPHTNGTMARNKVAKTSGNASLFASTSRTIASGKVVGVFPEGTSYHEPRIMQVKEGAAWSALEYVRWAKENATATDSNQELALIPVGIVYTDKSQYLSRIHVRYGKPIPVSQYTAEYLQASSSNSEDVDLRSIVTKMTADIKNAMFQLTVNAPDWDTLRVAEMSRDILWNDTNGRLPLKDWVNASQILVDIFSPEQYQTIPDSMEHTRSSLLRYAGLLHYTGIRHEDLTAAAPLTSTSNASPPTRLRAFRSLFYQLAATLLHPRFVFFLPVFLVHAPGYMTGYIASRKLTNPAFVETRSQFKVIFGGLGFGLSYAAVTVMIFKLLRVSANTSVGSIHWRFASGVASVLASTVKLVDGAEGWWGRMKGSLVMAGLAYGAVKFLAKWHGLLVQGNYSQFRRLMTSFKIFSGLLFPSSVSLATSEVGRYSRPPRPPLNPFVKYPTVASEITANGRQPPSRNGMATGSNSTSANGSADGSKAKNGTVNGNDSSHAKEATPPRVPNVPYYKLIRHLLVARVDAVASLRGYLEESKPELIVSGRLSDREWGKVFERADTLFKN